MVLADSFTDAGLLAGFVVGDGSAGSVAFSVGPALTTIEGTRPNRFLGMGDEEGVKRFTQVAARFGARSAAEPARSEAGEALDLRFWQRQSGGELRGRGAQWRTRSMSVMGEAA